MINVIKALFYKRDNSDYLQAKERISNVRKLLEERPKSVTFKEIYITEINF